MGDVLHPRLIGQIASILGTIRTHGLLSERWLEAQLHEAITIRRARLPNEDREVGARRNWLSRLVRKPLNDRGHAKRCAEVLLLKGDVSSDQIRRHLTGKLESRTAIYAIRDYLMRHGLASLAAPLDALGDEAFANLIDASVYRFAYGRFGEVEFDQQLIFGQTSGAYVIYLKASGSGVLERRLLAFRSDPLVSGVRAVELYRENGKLRMRTGLIAPRIGVHSVLLSDEISPALTRDLLNSFSSDAADSSMIDGVLAEAMQSQDGRSWLEMHSLAFYSLRSDSSNRISGAFLDGDKFGAMVGRRVEGDRITGGEIEKLAPLGRSSEADLDRADRILIDEMPRLSVDELMREVATRIEAS
ncbi:hypothetical protein [Glycocaulis sp.]|uniref:hypothetical protein n=1 Tax=Glycocaulis sp. TaxID=1969725 RepID=UPI003F6FC7A3